MSAKLFLAAAAAILVASAGAMAAPDRTNPSNPSMGDLSDLGGTTLGAETAGGRYNDLHFRDTAHPRAEARREARDRRDDRRSRARGRYEGSGSE